jgi:2-oxoisovalerate dehydrogenase E1 component
MGFYKDRVYMEMPQVNWRVTVYQMLLSREIDRLEVEELAPRGKVKYQFSSAGHELPQVLLAQAMNHPYDAVAVYYRSRPFMLAAGLKPAQAFAAGMARQSNLSAGRDTGVVYNLPRQQSLTVLPASGNVGAQYTPAAGWAQAIRYRQQVLHETGWEGALAAALGGDGSVAANGFWSALVIATTLQLPMLFFIEDNQFGISVPASLQTPGGDIAVNLASFKGLHVLTGNGSQPEESWQVIQEGVLHVRSGKGPCLLRMRVPRLEGHTFIDDQSYKSADLRAQEAEQDPITQVKAYLLSGYLTPLEWKDLEDQIQQDARQALAEAEASPQPDPDQAMRNVFYEGNAPLQGGLRPEGAMIPVHASPPQPSGPRINFIDAVRRTMETELKINPRMLVFGEDVGVKGGVHGATLDMHRHFGSARVFDTSLSEEGIMGRSVGLALAGLLPVPEIQFRKYADPAHEQITDLGTLRWRTANHFAAPVVVRIPVGYGKKTGDPWHSVTAEAIYAHTLGWRIAFPSNAEDAVGLLRTALRGDDPTFFLEHRALLDTREGRRPYPGDDYCLPFGKASVLTQGNELVVITWGEVVHRCLEAAASYPGRVQIIDLRSIIPWDQETVLEAVRSTGKALVVHEDTYTAGFAGEVIATIASQAFTDLDAPLERLTTPDVPIPYNLGLMEAVIPSTDRIWAKIGQLLAY